MKYMFSLIAEEGRDWTDGSPEAIKEEMDRWAAFGQEAVEKGAFVAGEALQESPTATTLKIQEGGGDPTVTDGPFAEAKEQLGGFYLLDCKDLDEALEWARKIPLSRGAIEVRPVQDFSEYGYEDPTAQAQEAARR